MAKRSPITKSRQKIIIFIALAIIIGATFFSLRNYSNPSIIVINSLSKIYSVQYISSNTLFVGGVYFNSTYSQGVAGLYYLNNDTFVPFPLSKYFKGGIVYTAFFNGSSYIIGGSTVISNQLHTSLIEIYPDGLIKNISDILSPFYSIGQVFSVSWNNNYKYWLVGGTAYVLINTNQSYLIPFLIKIYANGTYKDLTPELPEQFKILGSSEIYSISFSPDGSLAMIAGSNVINMTASIYNNTNFTEVKFGYLPLGVLFSTAWSPSGWIIGGENLTNPNTPAPFLAIVKNNLVIPITLQYKIGIVTSVSYGNEIYVVALRVPFENATGSFNYGSVLLSGASLSSLHLIYQKGFMSIENVDIINNEIVASGYEQSGNNYLGILLILKT